jgi:hypothetical protein
MTCPVTITLGQMIGKFKSDVLTSVVSWHEFVCLNHGEQLELPFASLAFRDLNIVKHPYDASKQASHGVDTLLV